MNSIKETPRQTAFHALTPDTVLSLVEEALAVRLNNICRPLISYINRVYELENEAGTGLVVKFYRPGRWSEDALQDEHDFLLELTEKEIPVIAPLTLQNGRTLGNHEQMHFVVFPKKSGRSFDEYNDDQWLELGRLLGRVHSVGDDCLPRDRISLAPDKSTREQIDYILANDFIPGNLREQFSELTTDLLNEISPLFDNTEKIRIHGDCHFANLIYRPDESFYIIDFDDMSVGPPVQDFWMLLPDYHEESLLEIDLFLEGYETFRNFDRRTLRLIEPLRAMRFIHYTAWCAHQVVEDGRSHVAGAGNFGSQNYWEREIRDLGDQLERIRTGPVPTGNV